MKYILTALSSNKTDWYEVTVFTVDGKAGISCDCPATVLCRHILALITGDTENVFIPDLNKPREIKSALEIIQNSDIPERYNSLMSELEEVKKEFKKQEKGIKRQINMLCAPRV